MDTRNHLPKILTNIVLNDILDELREENNSEFSMKMQTF